MALFTTLGMTPTTIKSPWWYIRAQCSDLPLHAAPWLCVVQWPMSSLFLLDVYRDGALASPLNGPFLSY